VPRVSVCRIAARGAVSCSDESQTCLPESLARGQIVRMRSGSRTSWPGLQELVHGGAVNKQAKIQAFVAAAFVTGNPCVFLVFLGSSIDPRFQQLSSKRNRIRGEERKDDVSLIRKNKRTLMLQCSTTTISTVNQRTMSKW
jgi:hypothetical protein